MRETLLWAAAYGLAWLAFCTVVLPRLRGRIRNDQHAEYRQTPEWHALRQHVAARRGYRCAARYRCAGPLHLHHWDLRSYGYDKPWQLVFLCERHHHSSHRWSAHWWSEVLFSSR